MKILIAPWGNPAQWREKIYTFEGKCLNSKTSLKIVQEVLNPDQTVIIGLDTLAEKSRNYSEVKVDAEERIRGFADGFELKGYGVLVAPGIGTFKNGIFTGNA
ncbi:TPA: CRISPR-associated protein, partial [Candidatus Bathyarchaeota archaeon]|nr:CRISPR-associated protein [Candidatus Bathyarchaeota archaeon]